MHISKYLFKLAKTPVGDLIAGIAFGNFSSLLPVKKIAETECALAFWHPKPFWEYHVLIVPKHPIRSLMHINPDNATYIVGMYSLLQEVVHQLNWEDDEYSTLINGGKRQEVGQLHMHLFKGSEIGQSETPLSSEKVLNEILKSYPFLTNEERDNYLVSVKHVSSDITELERVSEYLKLLKNPHAGIVELFTKNSYIYPSSINRPSDYSGSLPYISPIKDILYIDVPKFSDPEDLFSSALDKELSGNISKGYILDLRKNGGGNEKLGYILANYFFPKGRYVYGKNVQKENEDKLVSKEAVFNSVNEHPLTKPIVLLISRDTASSAERFVALMKCLPNVTTIGSETWGGSANPKWIPVTIDNKEYNAAIPTWRFFLNGSLVPLEESKIKPDIFFDPTDIKIIGSAVDYLKSN